MKHLVAESGAHIEVESAGTAGYHTGGSPDPRSAEEALRHGIDISEQRSRQFHVGDFAFFDLVIAMDESNMADLIDLAPDEAAVSRIRRLREFDPAIEQATASSADLDVPDPYYEDGFDGVYEMIKRSCAALLESIEPG